MISIFPKNPFEIYNRSGDPQAAAYHFDAIAKITTELKTVYTRYPLETGVEASDHAYHEPAKMTVYGYTGSKDLRITLNNPISQLAEFGASAVIGNIDNPLLSAAAGAATGLIRANSTWLAGSQLTRGASTLDFLARLQGEFETFDVITGLIGLRNMKIDSLISNVTPENEMGLEFIMELSQQFYVGEASPEVFTGEDLEEIDNARLQNMSLLDRGRIALV